MTFALMPTVPSASKVLATLNPNDKSARITLSNGNLTATGDGTVNFQLVRSTFPILRPSYWEVALSGVGNTASGCVDIVGLQDASISPRWRDVPSRIDRRPLGRSRTRRRSFLKS
jgi:hypothetical protein